MVWVVVLAGVAVVFVSLLPPSPWPLVWQPVADQFCMLVAFVLGTAVCRHVANLVLLVLVPLLPPVWHATACEQLLCRRLDLLMLAQQAGRTFVGLCSWQLRAVVLLAVVLVGAEVGIWSCQLHVRACVFLVETQLAH